MDDVISINVEAKKMDYQNLNLTIEDTKFIKNSTYRSGSLHPSRRLRVRPKKGELIYFESEARGGGWILFRL
jgi:hypothetical protein